jgi:hypothetical protein
MVKLDSSHAQNIPRNNNQTLKKYSDSWTYTKKSQSAKNAFERKVLRKTLGPMKETTTWRVTYNNVIMSYINN